MFFSGNLLAAGSPALVVFAATSLTDAFDEIATEFEASHPEADILRSYTPSVDLAIQVAEGAPADVFALAKSKQSADRRG